MQKGHLCSGGLLLSTAAAKGYVEGSNCDYRICLDSLSEMRQKILLREFLKALTEGSKPIELYAYDSFRYVGDMLAWAHSAAASEREILELLFISEDSDITHGLQEGLSSEPWTSDIDIKNIIEELADRNLHLICRPLKVNLPPVFRLSLFR